MTLHAHCITQRWCQFGRIDDGTAFDVRGPGSMTHFTSHAGGGKRRARIAVFRPLEGSQNSAEIAAQTTRIGGKI